MVIYPYGLKIDGDSLWVGWVEDEFGDQDVLELNSEGHLKYSLTVEEFLDGHDRSLIEIRQHDGEILDLDKVNEWLTTREEMNPQLILDAWNFFGDLARSVGKEIETRSAYEMDVYEKLFLSLNLLTTDGPLYEPDWSETQLDCIADVIRNGQSLLSEALER
jgi:hypothetical protein